MSKPVWNEHRLASGESREAVAHRPILFRGLENVHEHVLRAEAGAVAEQLREPPEQRLLLFYGTGAEYGDLDKQEIVAPVDAEIGASLLPVQPLRPGQIQIGGPRQRRAPPDLPRGNKFGAAIQGANSQRIAGWLARNGRIDRGAAIRAERVDNPVAAIR